MLLCIGLVEKSISNATFIIGTVLPDNSDSDHVLFTKLPEIYQVALAQVECTS